MIECLNNTANVFHLVAFSTSETGQLILFTGVFLMYLMAVSGNLLITALICLVSQLHTPMYFFLSNLAVSDILYVSSILPKLMSITLTNNKAISFPGCITQIYFLVLSAVCDMFLLSVMAYDRYVAICKPLQYHLLMNRKVCIVMAACSWGICGINAAKYSVMTSILTFCFSHSINHFYCDMRTMYTITMSDTTSREILISVDDVIFVFLPFSLVITSYVFIISAIMKIRSSAGRLKAFSCCTSHLTTVILFYSPAVIHNGKSDNGTSKEWDKWMSLIYMALVPMLNPLVYSLRNKEVLDAIRNIPAITGRSLSIHPH